MEEMINILQQIPEIKQMLGELLKLQKEEKIEKKWLNTEEVAKYLGYSTDSINRLKKTVWQEGIHFYKPNGRIVFDKNQLDEWVRFGDNIQVDEIVNNTLSALNL